MNTATTREYAKQRAAGYAAATALRNAKIKIEFDTCDDVRLRWIEDRGAFDDSYIDTWTDQTDAQRERARKDLWASIERDGVWGLVSEVRCPCCGTWVEVDSCWGFVGQDAHDYTFDIMQSALDARRIATTTHEKDAL